MAMNPARGLITRHRKAAQQRREYREWALREQEEVRRKHLQEVQRSFHQDPEVALQAYFIHNGRGLRSRLNYHPKMIRRAVEFDYLNWPRKIMDEVRGKDILDVGCGTGLHAVGFLVVGVKSYTGMDPVIEMSSDQSKNLRARVLDGFGWTPTQMQRRLPRVHLIPGTFEQVAPSRTFDVAVLHNVTEHLIRIADVLEGVWERLRPDGTVVFNHHNFFCWNGHHQPPKFVDEIEWDDPEQMKFVDWNHLAYDPAPEHYLSTGLNRMRMEELRALTERFFSIEMWAEIESKENNGKGRLTDEIRSRYPDVAEREFTIQSVLCRGRRRPTPLTAEQVQQCLAEPPRSTNHEQSHEGRGGLGTPARGRATLLTSSSTACRSSGRTERSTARARRNNVMPATLRSPALSAQEVGFFRDNGYLVKRGILDPALTEMAVNRVWQELPARFDRNDPYTWFGQVLDCGGRRTVEQRRGRVKFRECLRTEPPMLDLITNNDVVWDTVEQLLGRDQVKRPTRIRGLYPILPCPDRAGQTVKGHFDKHAYHVSVIGYLEDVCEAGGAFMVWPGSHADLYSRFRTRHERTLKWSGLQRMYSLECSPGCEIPGKAGDVIFYHHRVVHAAGINTVPHVRQAVLADFSRLDIEELTALKPSHDMWEDWAV